jgi:hypothetical protein
VVRAAAQRSKDLCYVTCKTSFCLHRLDILMKVSLKSHLNSSRVCHILRLFWFRHLKQYLTKQKDTTIAYITNNLNL